MTILATAHPAKAPRTKEAKRIAVIYAAILAVMAVAQLTSFTKFVLVLDSYWLPGGVESAAFLAGFLIISEVLASAFLLRFKLSMAFRIFTMGLGWLVPIIWFALTLRVMVVPSALSNVGFLGGYVHLIPGWWAVCVSLALAILAAWASWGLWPLRRSKKTK